MKYEQAISRRSLLKGGVAITAGTIGAMYFGAKQTWADTITTMRLGSDSAVGDVHTYSMVYLKEELEKRTNGRIKGVMFPNSQLGSNEVMVNSVKVGALDALMVNLDVYASAVPEVDILTLPFLFKDTPHAIRALEGKFGDIVRPKIEKAYDCTIVGWGTDGARVMWNKVRPIRTLADIKGLKMRVTQSRTHQDTYAALGALPTVIPFSELYSALQTGVVDGADIGLSSMLSKKYYQVTKYVTLTRHISVLGAVTVSNKFMSKLSEKDRALVHEIGAVAGREQARKTYAQEKEAQALMAKDGLTYYELKDPSQFSSRMTSIYDSVVARVPDGQKLVELARAIE